MSSQRQVFFAIIPRLDITSYVFNFDESSFCINLQKPATLYRENTILRNHASTRKVKKKNVNPFLQLPNRIMNSNILKVF